tara:strand:+ start:3921 stop:4148 length:228 start_codon:yes stop_codon:yes gene_type:complete
VLINLDSGEIKMSIITTEVNDNNSFFVNAKNSIKSFKDKYCPDGQTCETILTFGLLIGCFVFMYVAMEPIIHPFS